MDSLIQAFRVQNLETRIDLRRFACTSLELEFEFAQTSAAKHDLARQLKQEMKGFRALKFALELLIRGAA
jgi:hypothetical protein